MNEKFLKEQSLQEVAAQFDKELSDYVKEVMAVDDQAVLADMEQAVIKEQQEVDKYIGQVKYQLPKEVVFDGEKRSLARIAGDIIYFLNKKEVEWQYTNGLYELVKFWKGNNPTTISYGAYDSTLRLLNQVQYKGFEEWRNILAINEYMKVAHEQYSKDTSWVYFEAEKHNAILDRMKQLDDIKNQVDTPEDKKEA